MKQRILMNKTPINQTATDFSGEQIFANFPNSTEAFEVQWHDEEDSLERGYEAYVAFYDTVFENRNSLPLFPYRYGSF